MVGQPGLEPLVQFEIRVEQPAPFSMPVGQSMAGGYHLVFQPQQQEGEGAVHLVEMDHVVVAGKYRVDRGCNIVVKYILFINEKN